LKVPKGDIVAFRETTFQLLTINGTLPVTTQFVSTVLSNDRRKHGLVNRKKSADDLSISDLQFANELVDWLGGVENAIIAINAYSQLISS
jgi:hypothetical protein